MKPTLKEIEKRVRITNEIFTNNKFVALPLAHDPAVVRVIDISDPSCKNLIGPYSLEKLCGGYLGHFAFLTTIIDDLDAAIYKIPTGEYLCITFYI